MLFRSPQFVSLPAKKPAGVVRIFVFGESAAMGDPRPAYGFPRQLATLLENRHPSNRFEIVNVAMTAINSHAVRAIAEECAQLQGDFWVIYMGNNEVMGPYGAGGAFGWTPKKTSVVRAGLALRKSRLYQWLSSLASKSGANKRAQAPWRGMEMFMQRQVAPGDSSLKLIYENFEENAEAIVKAGLDSGATVLLSTGASNLKDCQIGRAHV